MTHPNSIWIELNSKAPNGVEPRAWRELQSKAHRQQEGECLAKPPKQAVRRFSAL